MLGIKEICENNFTYADYIRFTQTRNKLERIYKLLELNPDCIEPRLKADFEDMLDTLRVFDLQLRDTFVLQID